MSLVGPSGKYFNTNDGIELKFYENNKMDSFKKTISRSRLVNVQIAGFDNVVTNRSELKKYVMELIDDKLENKVNHKAVKEAANEIMKFVPKNVELNRIIEFTNSMRIL